MEYRAEGYSFGVDGGDGGGADAWSLWERKVPEAGCKFFYNSVNVGAPAAARESSDVWGYDNVMC